VHPDTYLALELRRWLQEALSCQHSLCHLNFISTFSIKTPGLGTATPFGTRSCKFWIVIGPCLATAMFFSRQANGATFATSAVFWENKNSLLLPASSQLGPNRLQSADATQQLNRPDVNPGFQAAIPRLDISRATPPPLSPASHCSHHADRVEKSEHEVWKVGTELTTSCLSKGSCGMSIGTDGVCRLHLVQHKLAVKVPRRRSTVEYKLHHTAIFQPRTVPGAPLRMTGTPRPPGSPPRLLLALYRLWPRMVAVLQPYGLEGIGGSAVIT
jgi:hypothetical protein